jgi:hypothetical protein
MTVDSAEMILRCAEKVARAIIQGLSDFPQATRASLTIIDRQGYNSTPVTADFSQADIGGPTNSNAAYDIGSGV